MIDCVTLKSGDGDDGDEEIMVMLGYADGKCNRRHRQHRHPPHHRHYCNHSLVR